MYILFFRVYSKAKERSGQLPGAVQGLGFKSLGFWGIEALLNPIETFCLGLNYIPLGMIFYFYITQEDIKHIIFIKVLRGV